MSPLPDDLDSVRRASRDPLDVLEIVEHQGFVRSLARALVADPSSADDLVQETYVRVLEHSPERPRSVRGWLARVVANLARDRRRSDRRRVERELVPPVSAAAPSTDDLVQRVELQKRLAEQVLALEPAQREVVLLHHFEGLSVADSAARLGVPLETARTRLRRALERLRHRLERELGGRDAALAALVALDRPITTTTSTSTVSPPSISPDSKGSSTTTTAVGVGAAGIVGGVFVMSSGVKLALVAVALLTVGGVATWSVRHDRSARSDDVHGSSSERVERSPVGEAAQVGGGSSIATPIRTELAAPPEPSSAEPSLVPAAPDLAALRVRTIWDASGQPAPNVALRVVHGAWGARLAPTRRVQTNERGEVVLRDLGAGETDVAVACSTTASKDGRPGLERRLALAAGSTSEVVLRLPEPTTIVGRVVDEANAPVADARIWVEDWSGGFSPCDGSFVTTADGNGRFELTTFDGAQPVSASAPGFAMACAKSAAPIEPGCKTPLKLVLSRQVAAIRGRVVAADGRPVADARIVAVGHPRAAFRRGADRMLFDRPSSFARSDGDGRFQIDGLHVGTIAVAVLDARFAPQQSLVEVAAGRTTEVDFTLRVGGTIVGSLKDDVGEPLHDVEVQAHWTTAAAVGDEERTTRTDARGEFTLERLPPSESVFVHLHAGAEGHQSFFANVDDGATLRHDFVATRGRSLRGRIVDEAGRPVAGCRIVAKWPTKNPDFDAKRATSGDDGRFECPQCCDADHQLDVYDPTASSFPALTFGPVRPGGAEFTIVYSKDRRPSARIVGRLLRPDGAQAAEVFVDVGRAGETSSIGMTVASDGAITAGPYPPGRYVVRVCANGFEPIDLGEHELLADATLDLGEIRLARMAR